MTVSIFKSFILTVCLINFASIPSSVSASNANVSENDDENNATGTNCCGGDDDDLCCWGDDPNCCGCNTDESLQYEYPVICCRSDGACTYACSITSIVLGSLACGVLATLCCFECCIAEKPKRRNTNRNVYDSESSEYDWPVDQTDYSREMNGESSDFGPCGECRACGYSCNPCGCNPCTDCNPCKCDTCGSRFCQGVFVMALALLAIGIAVLVREQRKLNNRKYDDDSESDEDSYCGDDSSSDESASSDSTAGNSVV